MDRRYRRILVTDAWVSGGFGLRGALLDSIVEFHFGDDFWQLVLAVETTSGFLCTLDELEHHGECGLVRQAALRADRSMTDGREHTFDFPVLGRKIIEFQQHIANLVRGP